MTLARISSPGLLGGVALIIASWLAGCAVPAPAPASDPTLPAGDYQMAAAIGEARRTLPDFLAVMASPPAGSVGFRLRVSVSDGKRREFVWIMPFQAQPDGRFAGTVADDPAYLENLVRGQALVFERGDIVDWGYSTAGHEVGSRTVCVMIRRMPAERADSLRREYGLAC